MFSFNLVGITLITCIIWCVVLSGLDVTVTLQHHQTCVAASLHDICVQDHIANAVYPKVLLCNASFIFNADWWIVCRARIVLVDSICCFACNL